MDRRTFAQSLATAALTAAVPSLAATPASLSSNTNSSPAAESPTSAAPKFGLSVMLWTVFNDMPFEDRLAKVVESGYSNVQLVGEYSKWTQADFDRAVAAAKRLGIQFDATAGLHNGVANPAVRDAFLAELREGLVPMETLGCPAMIVLSGNVVPDLSHQAQHDSCVETLKQAAKVVEGKAINGQPVRLLLECIHLEENPKYFLTSAAEAIEVVRAVNHPQVQFLYDMYHEQMSYGNLIDKLDKHIDVIGLIHVADVPGRHEPGTGEIDHGNIFKKLAQLNYRRNVAMEFIPTGNQVAALKAAKTLALSAGAV
jgi:hydroxypyruvate isomerase